MRFGYPSVASIQMCWAVVAIERVDSVAMATMIKNENSHSNLYQDQLWPLETVHSLQFVFFIVKAPYLLHFCCKKHCCILAIVHKLLPISL